MDSRSTEKSFYKSFFPMYDNSLGWSDLMVATSIADDINKSIFRDEIYKPTYLIAVCFDNNIVITTWIDSRYSASVGIYKDLIHIWGDRLRYKAAGGEGSVPIPSSPPCAPPGSGN